MSFLKKFEFFEKILSFLEILSFLKNFEFFEKGLGWSGDRVGVGLGLGCRYGVGEDDVVGI